MQPTVQRKHERSECAGRDNGDEDDHRDLVPLGDRCRGRRMDRGQQIGAIGEYHGHRSRRNDRDERPQQRRRAAEQDEHNRSENQGCDCSSGKGEKQRGGGDRDTGGGKHAQPSVLPRVGAETDQKQDAEGSEDSQGVPVGERVAEAACRHPRSDRPDARQHAADQGDGADDERSSGQTPQHQRHPPDPPGQEAEQQQQQQVEQGPVKLDQRPPEGVRPQSRGECPGRIGGEQAHHDGMTAGHAGEGPLGEQDPDDEDRQDDEGGKRHRAGEEAAALEGEVDDESAGQKSQGDRSRPLLYPRRLSARRLGPRTLLVSCRGLERHAAIIRPLLPALALPACPAVALAVVPAVALAVVPAVALAVVPTIATSGLGRALVVAGVPGRSGVIVVLIAASVPGLVFDLAALELPPAPPAAIAPPRFRLSVEPLRPR